MTNNFFSLGLFNPVIWRSLLIATLLINNQVTTSLIEYLYIIINL